MATSKPKPKPKSKPKPRPAAAMVAGDPKLEAAIAADVDGVEAYLVYADWLQSHGDPRGELIALQHARAQRTRPALVKAEHALLAKHAAHFYGPLAPAIAPGIGKHGERPPFYVDWHLGYFKTARVSGTEAHVAAEMLAHLVALPSAKLLRGLAFGEYGGRGQVDYTQLVAQLVKAAGALPHLASLYLGDFAHEEWQNNWTHVGKLERLYRAFPRLQRLIVHGDGIDLGKLDLPELRELEIHTQRPAKAVPTAIAKAKLPKLERLAIDMDYTAGDGQKFAAFFDGRFPRLRHLAFEWVHLSRAELTALCTGETLAQLATLSLASNAITDTKAELLAQHAARFAHLESLDLDNNFLSPAGRQRLAKLCRRVELGRQQRPDPLFEWDA